MEPIINSSSLSTGSRFELHDYCLTCHCQFNGFPLCWRSEARSCSATYPIQRLWNSVDDNSDSTGEFVDRSDSFIKREINVASKIKSGATNVKFNSSSQSSETVVDKRSGVTETSTETLTSRAPVNLTTSPRPPRRMSTRPRHTVGPTVRVNTTRNTTPRSTSHHGVTTRAPVITTTPMGGVTRRTTIFQYMSPYTVVWGHRTGPIVYRPPPGVAECGDHAVGEIYTVDCNSCRCTRAGPRCTLRACRSSAGTPAVVG